MRTVKPCSWLMLLIFLAGCASPAPASTPTAAATSTRTPTHTSTRVPTSTPTPTPTPYPPLRSEGPYLVYLRDAGNGPELAQMDADGRGSRSCPEPAETWRMSHDGRWMAFHTGEIPGEGEQTTYYNSDLALNLMDMQTCATTAITKLLSPDFPGGFQSVLDSLDNPQITLRGIRWAFNAGINSLAWSPDGSSLAFAGQMDGGSSDVYLLDLASREIKRLTSGPQEIIYIGWSPAGDQIVYTAANTLEVIDGRLEYDIIGVRPDGSGSTLLSQSMTGAYIWLDSHTYLEYDGYDAPPMFNIRSVNIQTGEAYTIWPDGFITIEVDQDTGTIALSNFDPFGFYLVNAYTGRRIGIPNDAYVFAVGEKRFRVRLSDTKWGFLTVDGRVIPSSFNPQDTFLLAAPAGDRYAAIGAASIQIYDSADALLGEIVLPTGCESVDRLFWRPDSSGLFFPCGSNLYLADFLTFEPILVENRLANPEHPNASWTAVVPTQ